MAEISIIESLLLGAVKQESPEKRHAYLDEHCPDPATREEVERLLAAHPDAESFLQHPALAAEATVDSATPHEGVGTQVGPYKLLQLIGEGGFGLVFMAEQKAPIRRKVALKIIKPGMDTKEVIGRFEAERQALALMDHPNVAKVLDAGTTQSGRPYFVMELVRGTSITEFCDENNLDTRERLELFIPVCRAIQHAHQKAIIHRDIKPTNVLVTMHDDKAVPKVIDFGIAKALHTELTARTVFTQFQQMIGTPAYMSPEQAQMSGLDVDTRCDVYALGVLLYELLTGTTPFDPKELLKGGYDEICRRIREQEPPKPSNRVSTMDDASRTAAAKSRKTDPEKLGWLMRGDLDWVVMKAMEKDRTRRYETASGLAQDVACFLANEPVTAVAPSSFYRWRKFLRRNKATVLTAAAFALLLIVGTVLSSWLAIAANRNLVESNKHRAAAEAATELANKKTIEATREKEHAMRLAYNRSMTLMLPDWKRGNLNRIRRNLESTSDWDQRGFEWHYWQRQMHRHERSFPRGRGHWALAISRDGSRIATGQEEVQRGTGSVVIWNPATAEIVETLPQPGLPRSIDFSPNCAKLFSSADHGASLWDLATTTSKPVTVKGANVVAGVFSPNGRQLLVGCDDGSARLLDSDSLEEELRLESQHRFKIVGEGVAGLAFSPDGKRLATCAWGDNKVCVFNQGETDPFLMIQLEGIPYSLMQAVCFSPDGSRIAFGSPQDPLVHVRNLENDDRFTLKGHDRGIFGIDWVGERIYTAGADSTARVWDVAAKRQVAILKGHSGPLWKIKALPSNSNRFVTCTPRDGETRLWDLEYDHEPRVLSMKARCLTYLPDGRHLAVGCEDGTIKIVNAASGTQREVKQHDVAVIAVKVFSNGQLAVTSDADNKVRVWELASGKVRHAFDDHQSRVQELDVSYDGRWLATAERFNRVRVRDLRNRGQIVFETTVHGRGISQEQKQTQGVAISPDGKHLVTAGEDRKLRLWDRENSQQPVETKSVEDLGQFIGHIEYSFDGSVFVTGGFGRLVCVWDSKIPTPLAHCDVHTQWINGVAISRDGKRVVSASHDGTARLWDASTGDELLTLEHENSVGSVAISPDGRQIVTTTQDGNELFIWDAHSHRTWSDAKAKTRR